MGQCSCGCRAAAVPPPRPAIIPSEPGSLTHVPPQQNGVCVYVLKPRVVSLQGTEIDTNTFIPEAEEILIKTFSFHGHRRVRLRRTN